MVDIVIFLEGGVLPHANVETATVDNSQKLREAFHTLLSQLVDESKFNLKVEIAAGEKNAVKFFQAQASTNANALLLIDLDALPTEKTQKISAMGLTAQAAQVVFMVQKMEAWILSQPQRLDDFLSEKYSRKRSVEAIADDSSLKGKNLENMYHPDRMLDAILQRYFVEIKRGEEKKKKYGKLKDAPDLVANLDAQELKTVFSDVENLYLRLT